MKLKSNQARYPRTTERPNYDPGEHTARKYTGIARTVKRPSAEDNDIDPVTSSVGKYLSPESKKKGRKRF